MLQESSLAGSALHQQHTIRSSLPNLSARRDVHSSLLRGCLAATRHELHARASRRSCRRLAYKSVTIVRFEVITAAHTLVNYLAAICRSACCSKIGRSNCIARRHVCSRSMHSGGFTRATPAASRQFAAGMPGRTDCSTTPSVATGRPVRKP